MANPNYLFSYPGNKRKLIQILQPFQGVETFIETHAGSSAFTLQMIERYPNARFVVAEKDESIRNILRSCRRKETRDALISRTIEIRDTFRLSTNYWQTIKEDAIAGCGASKLVFQRIAHGSVARTSKNGQYNVVWSPDKVKSLGSWVPKLPKLFDADLTVLDSADCCFEQAYDNTCVFIDPPYYAPSKTRCYPGHNPASTLTAIAVVRTLEKAIKRECKQIWLTHYKIELVDDLIRSLDLSNYVLTETALGELPALGLGNGNFKHGGFAAKKKKIAVDTLYEFSRIF